MVNNYGVEFTMSELRKYTKRNRNQSSRRTKNKNKYTNRTNKGRNGKSQNFTRYSQPNENGSLMNSKVGCSQILGNDSVPYEHHRLEKSWKLLI